MILSENYKREKGFTLIEILIVIAIIAILFIMLLPMINNATIKAQERGVMTDFRSFQAGAESYLRETLGKDIKSASLNNYLDKGMQINEETMTIKDPWGQEYIFKSGDGFVALISFGKDEIESDDDYIFATYVENGQIGSCTKGFPTNNIVLEQSGISGITACGDGFGTEIADDPEESGVDSTDDNIALPEEMNDGCYVIRTVGQLQAIGDNTTSLSHCYELGNNIDASGTSSWNDGEGFQTIGTSGHKTDGFHGTFDGKGYSITGLTINKPSTNYIGLFGVVNGVVKDLSILNANVVGHSRVGILSGRATANVVNVTTNGNVTGHEFVGGLIGQQSKSPLSMGGVVSSYSEANVTGTYYIGGLIGENRDLITNSYSNGTVDGAIYTGGLSGHNKAGKISYSYSNATLVKNQLYVGGLVGLINGGGATDNSYFSVDTTHNSPYGGEPKSVTEMKQASTYTGWDFTNTWGISPSVNDGYPYLKNNPPH